MEPICVSYQRFSSPKQSTGDSIRRQTEARDQFLKRNGLTLSENFDLRDEGVSSFKGKHRSDKHELGRFLELVNAGRVPRGSYLILESLDRLSREDIDDAVELLLSLTKRGIRVVQLLPVEVVYQKPVDMLKMIVGIVELSRGNSESRMKSERVAAAWEQRRKQARESKVAISARCPAWLRKKGNSYEVIPEAAATVRLIFELTADGYGLYRLVRKLTRDGIKPIGTSGKWHAAYLGRILAEKAVLGVYQPMRGRQPTGDPIPDFYPAVVDLDLYERAQRGRRQRKSYKGGHSNHGVNLFQSLLWTHGAAGAERLEWKWRRDPRNSEIAYGRYTTKGGKTVSIQAAILERGILESLSEVDPRSILPPTERESDKRAELEREYAEVRESLRKIEDALVEGGSVRTLESAAKRLEEREQQLKKQLESAAENPKTETLAATQSLISALEATGNSEEARLRLQSAIRRTVSEVWCLFVKSGRREIACVQIHFRGSDHIRTVFVCHRALLSNTREKVAPFFARTTIKKLERADIRVEKYRRLVRESMERMLPLTVWNSAFEPDRPSPEQIERARLERMWAKQGRKRRQPGGEQPSTP